MTPLSVAVVGAGIIGTVAACFLRRDGHEVTLYEREAPGCAASWGNSGVLSPAAVLPVAMPGLMRRLPRWLVDETGPLFVDWHQVPRLAPWLAAFLRAGRKDRVWSISRALAALNGETLQLLIPLLEEAGLASMVRKQGMLLVESGPGNPFHGSLAASLREHAGHEVEFLEGSALRDCEPALSKTFTCGLFLPGTAHAVNPHRLVTGLASHFTHLGGLIRVRHVDRILAEGDAHAVIETCGEAHRHDVVVVAAGVWSKGLVSQLGYRVPLVPQRGYHVTFTRPGAALRTVILPVAAAATIVPMEMGIRIGGTVEFAGDDAPANPKRASALADHAKAAIPSLDTTHQTTWMGPRPCTPDSLPVLGRAPRHPAVLFAFGHGHQGLIGSSMTGKVIADLVAGRKPAIDLAPFDVGRFGLLSRLRRQNRARVLSRPSRQTDDAITTRP